MSIKVKYADIAIGAKEAFDISVTGELLISNIGLIKEEGAKFKRYDAPFELNSMILDGECEFLPESGVAEIGFVSEQMSNEDAKFDDPIVIQFISDEAFTSAGLAITFDEIKNIYATHINIKWYNSDTLLVDADFFPNSAKYFCNKKVEFYNKIVITYYSLNVPKNRLRINNIEYGLKVDFEADELRSAKMIQEIDPISTSVPINPFDFTIDSKKDIEFSFQTKQPIEVIFNDEKKATTFVKKARRKSKTIWEIQSEDYIGLMDSVYFNGGIYNNRNAVALLAEIFSVAKVPYVVSSVFDGATVDGYIPYTTCRNALMQVCFAIGAVVDTSNTDVVSVFSLNNFVSQNIEKRRIMQGQSFEDETRVTSVELIAHAYRETQENIVAYEAEKSGVGENIFVSFKEPIHGLTIQNGRIIEGGTNYAIINASNGCVLTGKKYEHTTVVYRKDNPFVLSTDIENIVAIENATLVSKANVDKLLVSCYNYIVNTETSSMKIIDGVIDNAKSNLYGSSVYGSSKYGGSETAAKIYTTVGDLIKYDTEYLGEKIGRIIKQKFSFVGNILIKDSVVRQI
jgi:hypothetical protein